MTPTERKDDAFARGPAVFGFEAIPLTPELQSWLGVAEDGLVVSTVTAGGAADRAGLERGDRLVTFAERDVRSPSDLSAAVDDALRRLAAGQPVAAEVFRGGKSIPISLVTGAAAGPR